MASTAKTQVSLNNQITVLPSNIYEDIEIADCFYEALIKYVPEGQLNKESAVRTLLSTPLFIQIEDFKSKQFYKTKKLYIPGHNFVLDQNNNNKFLYGPQNVEYKICIIGKFPGEDELRSLKNFVGASGKLLQDLILSNFPKNYLYSNFIYLTNLYKINLADQEPISVKYFHIFKHILLAELRLVRPKFILILGHDALKFFVGRAKFADYYQRPFEYNIKYADDSTYKTTVYSIKHPAHFLRNPDLLPEIYNSFKAFSLLCLSKKQIKEPTYSVNDESSIELLEKEIEEAKKNNSIVELTLDCEWHSKWYNKSSFFLRYIQFGLVINNELKIFILDLISKPEYLQKFVQILKCKENQQYIRLIGHNITADILALCSASNLEPKEFYNLLIPPGLSELLVILLQREKNYQDLFYKKLNEVANKTRKYGVFDTMLAAHVIDETSSVDLKSLSQFYLQLPAYDTELKDYIKKTKKIGEEEEGYGYVAEEILLPYAAWDIKATYELYKLFNNTLLDSDKNNNSCRIPFYLSLCPLYPYLEAQFYGVQLDMNIFNKLYDLFKTKADSLLNEIRKEINWPTFTGKGYQRQEFVYGYRSDMTHTRVSPEDARLLYFPCLISTEETEQLLEETTETEELNDFETDKELLNSITNTKTAYSTNQAILSILIQKYQSNPIYADKVKLLQKFKNWCFLTSILERVITFKESAGLLKYKNIVNGNYFLHPTFLNILKTGRTCIFKPNLQNLSKKREDDYKTIFGSEYVYPIRSIVTAKKGYKLVEADLVAAELMILAIVSQDKNLYELCVRSFLPKDHPNYLDVHSFLALKIIGRTDLEPKKEVLEQHGLISLRNAVKTAIYGLVYGQTAQKFHAVSQVNALPIRTIKEAEDFIQKIEDQFPKLMSFIKNKVPDFIKNNFYIYNCFNRFRRFSYISPKTFDDNQIYKKLMAKNIREGVNFIPQSIVAEIISMTCAFLQHIKQLNQSELDFRLVLQLHDALLYEVKEEKVEDFILLLKEIMENIPIMSDYINNTSPIKKYGTLKASIEIFDLWGYK